MLVSDKYQAAIDHLVKHPTDYESLWLDSVDCVDPLACLFYPAKKGTTYCPDGLLSAGEHLPEVFRPFASLARAHGHAGDLIAFSKAWKSGDETQRRALLEPYAAVQREFDRVGRLK